VSYSITNATAIEHQATISAGGDCTATSIFVVADDKSPYNVYGTFFASVKGINAGCGSVFSVDESGTMDTVIQNYTYFTNVSGVHGVALSPDSQLLYSADDTGNTLWTHSVDRATGEVTALANLTGPSPGSDPRHVAVHPTGNYLYVILEGTSQLAQYTVDRQTGLPALDTVYPLLISAQQDPAQYWADEVALSASNKYLWASNRGRHANTTGYVSVLSLDERGAIMKQNFIVPTSSSGGISNILSPSPYSDEFAVLTSNSTGFVEVWRLGEDAGSAAVVAHLDIDDGGGCCSNALWYS
jgi:carboxy-cis,cis-muconate cyclase